MVTTPWYSTPKADALPAGLPEKELKIPQGTFFVVTQGLGPQPLVSRSPEENTASGSLGRTGISAWPTYAVFRGAYLVLSFFVLFLNNNITEI